MATSYDPTSNKGFMADFRHASQIFRTGNMSWAPKTKYLYHVVFKMNPFVLQGRDIDKNKVSVLVKSAELPKITIQTETLNQYNRKKHTQVKVDYQPVVLKFHDDNSHVVSEMWKTYFSYYYADSISAKQPILTYVRNAMSNESINSVLGGAARYGYDNGSYAKFFNSIVIYQLTRGNWYSYELVNPIIQNWSHDSLDSSSNAPAEQSMTLLYEAIAYDNGSGNPPGFANADNYDVSPSPLTLGGSTGNSEIILDKASNATVVGQSNVNTASSTEQNTTYLTNNPITTNSTPNSLTTTIANNASPTVNLSGIKDINFPTNEQSTAIVASQVTL